MSHLDMKIVNYFGTQQVHTLIFVYIFLVFLTLFLQFIKTLIPRKTSKLSLRYVLFSEDS